MTTCSTPSPALLRQVADAIRVRDWASCKLAFLMVCLGYVLLEMPVIGRTELISISILFALFYLLAGFGYAINSYADLEDDVLAGKPNAFSRMSAGVATATIASVSGVTIVGSVAAASWFDSARLAFLIVVNVSLAAAYSLRPIRCKERGMVGVAVSAVAQRTLPALIVFDAFDIANTVTAALLLLSTVVGVRYILVHQIKDYDADVGAGVHTMTTSMGLPAAETLLRRIVFPAELLSLAATLALMGREQPAVLFAFGIFLVLALPQLISPATTDPLPTRTYAALAGFYYLYWPVTLAVLVVSRDRELWPIVLVVIIWSSRRLEREVRVMVRAFRPASKYARREAAH